MQNTGSNEQDGDQTPARSTFGEMVKQVANQPATSNGMRRAADLLDLEFDRQGDGGGPFLTVVMRTQGRRIEALKDALLCLYGQTDEDFDVLLVCHDIDEADLPIVTSVIESQPPSFRDRIEILNVRGGLRARPLNAAVAVARGRYLSFFDDDDLVFGHWVESFAAAAARGSGRLLRARVASQRAEPELWPQDEDGFRHTNWPQPEYTAPFDQLAHLRMNYSPFMCWAFPRQLFHSFGFRFDEQLYVCEDWDMILRGSLVCGVEEVHELTAIYRRWDGRESSYTAHHANDWQASQARVIAKLDRQPLLLPPGSATALISLLEARQHLHHVEGTLHAVHESRSWRMTEPVRAATRYATSAVRLARRVAGRAARSVRRG